MRPQITLALSVAAVTGAAGVAATSAAAATDMSGNAVITRAQAQADALAMFARLDVNKDGKIDQTDRALQRDAMKTRMFERLDKDGNGQISKAEFMADQGPGWRGKTRAMDRQAKDGDETPERGHGMHGGDFGGMRSLIKLADANGDGAITSAEFTAAALARFDAMDTNKDGQLTPAERQSARARMKAQWQQQRNARTQG